MNFVAINIVCLVIALLACFASLGLNLDFEKHSEVFSEIFQVFPSIFIVILFLLLPHRRPRGASGLSWLHHSRPERLIALFNRNFRLRFPSWVFTLSLAREAEGVRVFEVFQFFQVFIKKTKPLTPPGQGSHKNAAAFRKPCGFNKLKPWIFFKRSSR